MSATPEQYSEVFEGLGSACENLENVFNDLTEAFRSTFGFSPRYRQVIPAQDVVIEDVTEDEEKEDEDDGGNLRNRALPDVR